jgi:beta-lactamase superfamily II metal-dependent hydrolase
VGQGDAAVITTDDGATLVIDLGPKDGFSRVVSELGSTGPYAVLISHAHADHLGELDKLPGLTKTAPLALWEPGFSEKASSTYPKALALFERLHVPRVVARSGMHFGLGAHTELEVLGPRDPLFHGTRSDPNANSVVVRLTHRSENGAERVLFTGDAERPTETRLLEDPSKLAADVLKVAHHGSKHASSADLLRAVGAKVAVISCARDNDYGHPHAPALKRLAAAGAEIHRTDLEGDVTVELEHGHVTTHTARHATSEELARPGREPARGSAEAP